MQNNAEASLSVQEIAHIYGSNLIEGRLGHEKDI
jgi:hypothetical protein